MKLIIILMVLLFIPIVYSAGGDYADYLTIGQANTLYCRLIGCTINGLVYFNNPVFFRDNVTIVQADSLGINNSLTLFDLFGTPQIVLNASGDSWINNSNVGIGTTSPNYKLDLISTATSLLRLKYDGAADSYFNIDGDTTADINMYSSAWSGDLDIYTTTIGGVENSGQLFLKSNGNVGIGTDNPIRTLQVVREIAGTNSIVPIMNLKAVSSGNIVDGFGSALDFSYEDAGFNNEVARIAAIRNGADNMVALSFEVAQGGGISEAMRIAGSGNVGIGTTTPSSKLQVVGASGSPVFNLSNGTTGMYMDKSGNVGIGTDSPDGTLHVHTATAGAVSPSASADDLTIENSGTGGMSILTPDTAYSLIHFGYPSDNDAGVVGYGAQSVASDDYKDSMYFKTNGAVQVLLDSTGNLGIGTTNPGARLDVQSDAGGASSGIRIIQAAESGPTGSYVPIDFTVPTTGLIAQILATANNYANAGINLPANSLGLLAEAVNGSLTLIAGGANGDIRFTTGGYAVANERMRILKTGEVGIGTVTPGQKLDVVGKIQVTDDTLADPTGNIGNGTRISFNTDANPFAIGLGALDGDSKIPMWFQTGDVNGGGFEWWIGTDEKMTMDNAGNVGIGTATPNSKLEVNGNLNLTNGGNFTGNQIYGEMWNYSAHATPWTFDITADNTYFNFTGLVPGNLNGFTFTDETQLNGGSYLTALVGGVYKTDFSMSFSSNAVGGTFGIGIVRDFEVSNHRDCYARREAATDVGNVGVSCLMDLPKGCKVNIQVENEDNTRDMIIHTVNLNLMRVGD